jgi:zinc/manganese transport system ATP-binding protein
MAEAVTGERVVELERATLQFPERTVWCDVTLGVNEGEFIAVLGPNGSGKTSLLKVLLGTLRASSGRIAVFGKAPHRGNRLIGYVPQRRNLDPDLPIRGRDLVMLGVQGLRWGFPFPGASARDKAEVREALEAVEGTAYADRPIGRMSGGEQQRLLLAQALVGKPRLLILDEPLASLDIRNQEAIAQLVAKVARAEHITVLLVTHDINPVMPVMDRVVYIARESMIIGSPESIITSETMSALYGVPLQVIRDSEGRYLCSGRLEDIHPEEDEER